MLVLKVDLFLTLQIEFHDGFLIAHGTAVGGDGGAKPGIHPPGDRLAKFLQILQQRLTVCLRQWIGCQSNTKTSETQNEKQGTHATVIANPLPQAKPEAAKNAEFSSARMAGARGGDRTPDRPGVNRLLYR